MSSILSGARKYGLGLTLVHQDMEQLRSLDSELSGAILSNAATRICFRIGDTDAKKLESGFSHFDHNDLQNLDTGEALVRIEKANNDCAINIIPLHEIHDKRAISQAIVAKSRSKYAVSINEIVSEEEPESPSRQQIKEDAEPLVESHFEKDNSPELPIFTTSANQESYSTSKKEESQHKYLQLLIKNIAESKGFKVVLEELTPDGEGRIDVCIEKNELRIAVEVTISTKQLWELHNIQKCVKAGYNTVVVCSNDSKQLAKISKMIQQVDANNLGQIYIFTPEQLFEFLDKHQPKPSVRDELVKGYRVNVNYSSATSKFSKQAKDGILKNILNRKKK